jgi:Mg-chelatase subunit ChlD
LEVIEETERAMEKFRRRKAMDIIKKDALQGVSLTKGKLRSTSSPFQQRVNEAKANEVAPETMPYRICLMLDDSSSMRTYDRGGCRIDFLKTAVQFFVQRSNLADTSIALESFNNTIGVPLTSNPAMLDVSTIFTSGSTPMHRCLVECLAKHPMTRGVLVSDGEATDWRGEDADNVLTQYKEQGIPIDCVHISDDTSGEELLRKIARLTGGIYLKFTDVSAFSTAFAYLTPVYRAMLTDGRLTAEQIGAKEIR